jgi:hypothetical protein
VLKIYDTTKVFYNKYIYKVDLLFPLGSIFRDKNWKWARTVIDSHKNGSDDKSYMFFKFNRYPDEDYILAEKMYKFFTSLDKDYLIRIENPRMSFYTSEYKYVEFFLLEFEDKVKSFTKPYNKYTHDKLLNTKNIIIDEDSEWEYLLELDHGIEVNTILKKLNDTGKIYFRNKKVVKNIKCKNNKSLTLVQLLLENKIKKIYTIERGKHES